MKAKKWGAHLLLTTSILFISIPLINFYFDSTSANKSDFKYKSNNYYEGCYKTSYYEKNDYVGILFGSSLQYSVNVSLNKKYKTYNYSIGGSTVFDYLIILQHLKSINKLPEVVYIPLDFFIYNKNRNLSRYKFLSCANNNINSINKDLLNSLKITRHHSFSDVIKFVSRDRLINNIKYFLLQKKLSLLFNEDGISLDDDFTFKVNRDSSRIINHLKDDRIDYILDKKYFDILESLSSFIRINKIKHVLFFNPINKIRLNSMYKNNKNEYLTWKKETLKILNKHHITSTDLTHYSSDKLELFKDSVHMYNTLQDDVFLKVFKYNSDD